MVAVWLSKIADYAGDSAVLVRILCPALKASESKVKTERIEIITVRKFFRHVIAQVKNNELFPVFVRSSGYEHETRQFIAPSPHTASGGPADPQRI